MASTLTCRTRNCRERSSTKKLEDWMHQFWNLQQVGIDLRDDKVEMAPARALLPGWYQD